MRRSKYFALRVLTKLLPGFIIVAMAKYDALRKPEKKRLIREYHEAHPELSYREVGDMFGVDAAWAWRICNEARHLLKKQLAPE